jgi:hypothetical protein
VTKTEEDRFRSILAAKVVELVRLTRQREGIVVNRCADQLEEIQSASLRALAVYNLDREFTNFEMRVRHFTVSRMAALAHARSVMKTSIRSGLPPCRGRYFVYGVRKPKTAIMKGFSRQIATFLIAPPEALEGEVTCRRSHC